MQLRGRRATIMGLGHFGGGVSAARWLARQGAEVTVTDRAPQTVLARSLAALAHVPIARFHLGGHREADFRRTDLVVVNPAVRPDHPLLEIARQSGARLTSETELFLEACPARIIGVTGSNGKSTTAAMTAAILRAAGRRTWLGGNIGTSLLDRLDAIEADDWVVLELSSFQLRHLGTGEKATWGLSQFSRDHAERGARNGTAPFRNAEVILALALSGGARMPEVAVVTNCSPNHLDWHGSYAEYRSAKQQILTGQTAHDAAVLNTADAEVASWASLVRGRQELLFPEDEIPPLGVPGEHNRQNAVCAATAAIAAGCAAEAVRAGLASFSTLAQRLERVAVIDGRRFYNDSSSTTPDSTIAGLRALGEPIWLLAGGSDKGIDFAALIAAIAARARGAAFYGIVRRVLCDGVIARAPHFPCTAVETMDEALWWCWQRSRPGDSIVLSPACASHDQFQNFQARGERFAALVGTLSGALAEPRHV